MFWKIYVLNALWNEYKQPIYLVLNREILLPMKTENLPFLTSAKPAKLVFFLISCPVMIHFHDLVPKAPTVRRSWNRNIFETIKTAL